MKFLTVIISSFFFISIQSEKKQIMDFKYFTIEVPSNWQYVKKTGFDSFVGQININAAENLLFDFGRYSSSLTSSEDYFISNDSLFKIVNDTKKFYKMRNELSNKEMDSQFFYYQNISGLKAKIVIPAKIGKGLTGVYFKEDEKKNMIFNLEMHGINLELKNHESFLKAITTIKFKKMK